VPGQALTAIRAYAQLIRQRHPQAEDPARSAGLIINMAGKTYDDTHAMMRRLRPRVLDELGLVASLEACVEMAGLEAKGIVLHTYIDPALEDLDEGAPMTLYRLRQDVLTNVSRHSGARNVWMRAEWHGDAGNGLVPGADTGPVATLSVEDDGRGLQASLAGGVVRSGADGLPRARRGTGRQCRYG
jgi:two-component system sensor histidine kinase UhpB